MPGPHDTADSQYEQAAVDSGFCATCSFNYIVYNLLYNNYYITKSDAETIPI